MARVLVVDDERLMQDSLRETLSRAGHKVRVAGTAAEAVDEFNQGEFEVVITDLKLPDGSGLDVVRKIRKSSPAVPILVLTAYATVETAVEAMQLGARHYLRKGVGPDEIEVAVNKAVEEYRLRTEHALLLGEISSGEDMVWGGSPAMRQVREVVAKVTSTDATVLICGESGTGKEMVARAIHRSGTRRERPFLCVNCAALSAGLLESELFGHEKGAFTGAERSRKGRFELADQGTLLLDEVSEIDPNLQSKLLRVLQEKSFERVGSSETMKVDVRVIATTNRDLSREVTEHRFREDLFYRLNVLPIRLPALRDRKEDLPALVEHFLAKYTVRRGLPRPELAPGLLEALAAYDWPGNVRELENAVERACILNGGAALGPEQFLSGGAATRNGANGLDLAHTSLEDMELKVIRETLKRFNNHQEKTAASLGIGVRTLRDKIKKWGLKA